MFRMLHGPRTYSFRYNITLSIQRPRRLLTFVYLWSFLLLSLEIEIAVSDSDRLRLATSTRHSREFDRLSSVGTGLFVRLHIRLSRGMCRFVLRRRIDAP